MSGQQPGGGLCERCEERRLSRKRVAEARDRGITGMVCDPAPKAECKWHEGYGYNPPESRRDCDDYEPMF